ncbi:MAG: enoyl-CoA hydratase/isomerase family protein [Flavobacteriaceae bacterium]|nr:enoyl-CoA hydratase/isomerase family protein [Flavobacteriaceae bacterium]
MNQGTISTNITNKVATITFFHPASNSLPGDLLNRLTDTFNRLSDNNKVNIIVLKSEGEKAFCAGASFDELLEVNTTEKGKQFFSGFANLLNSMRKCSKLIIGRAQGKTVGGGVGILAASDYCFATEAASIKLSELSIGIGAFVIAPAVERKIGVSALSELSIDAENWKTAYWAKEKGLFARVFENTREMDKDIEILADKLASYNLDALKEWKNTLWKNTDHWDQLLLENAEISGKLVLSDFTKETLKKFKNK